MSSISAKSCIRAFLSTWVSRFGVPDILTSEQGAHSPPPFGPESAPPWASQFLPQPAFILKVTGLSNVPSRLLYIPNLLVLTGFFTSLWFSWVYVWLPRMTLATQSPRQCSVPLSRFLVSSLTASSCLLLLISASLSLR